jgi:hypothetical protein
MARGFPNSPGGGRMVGPEYGLFGSSRSGAHLPDGGASKSATHFACNSVACIVPVLLCCSDGWLSLVVGAIGWLSLVVGAIGFG